MATKKKAAKKPKAGEFIAVTKQEIIDARLDGFKTKKPTKPKKKSHTNVDSYVEKYNVWATSILEHAVAGAALRTKRAAMAKV